MSTESSFSEERRLYAFPPDPRIKQLRGAEALTYARSLGLTVDVDTLVGQGRGASTEDSYEYDIPTDSDELYELLAMGFVVKDFFVNVGVDEATEEALALELFETASIEENGYRCFQSMVRNPEKTPLAGALLSLPVLSLALVRLCQRGVLVAEWEGQDPHWLESAYAYGDVRQEPPAGERQLRWLLRQLKDKTLEGSDDLEAVVRLLRRVFSGSAVELLGTPAGRQEQAVLAAELFTLLGEYPLRKQEATRPRGLEPATIKFECEDGLVVGEGYVDPGVPGLGIAFYPEGRGWFSIIHTNTGRSVLPSCRELEEARRGLVRLGRLCDWSTVEVGDEPPVGLRELIRLQDAERNLWNAREGFREAKEELAEMEQAHWEALRVWQAVSP